MTGIRGVGRWRDWRLAMEGGLVECGRVEKMEWSRFKKPLPRSRNLLRTRGGRLAGFFGLYVSEGLPQGFAGTAVALEFKRMGMTGEAIGTLMAMILLPWSWKWLMGPLVDNLYLRRFGRRKQWIVLTQIGMVATLVLAVWMFPQAGEGADGARVYAGFGLFAALLLMNNVFAATQDVAIDALACTVLPEHERGTANGLMFAGAQIGSAIGGSGVLFLKGVLGFSLAALLVPLLVLGILTLVVWMLFEDAEEESARESAGGWRRALVEAKSYGLLVLTVFFRTRRGFLGLLVAAIPFGGMALSMTIGAVLAPTLGMADGEIAALGVVYSLVFSVACALGGLLSDRFGRRLTLSVFSVCTLLPTVWMGWQLQRAGWEHPVPALADGRWPRHEGLIAAWWVASVAYGLFCGLMYGIRTAFFMDIVEPRIAATHFTACMALLNVVTVYSYWWQGKAVTLVADNGWGLTYFQIFLLDALVGVLFLAVLPFLKGREVAR